MLKAPALRARRRPPPEEGPQAGAAACALLLLCLAPPLLPRIQRRGMTHPSLSTLSMELTRRRMPPSEFMDELRSRGQSSPQAAARSGLWLVGERSSLRLSSLTGLTCLVTGSICIGLLIAAPASGLIGLSPMVSASASEVHRGGSK